jgi:hypothetical protein
MMGDRNGNTNSGASGSMLSLLADELTARRR